MDKKYPKKWLKDIHWYSDSGNETLTRMARLSRFEITKMSVETYDYCLTEKNILSYSKTQICKDDSWWCHNRQN